MSNLCKFNNWADCQFVNWSDCVWNSFQDKKDAPGWPTNQPPRGGDEEKKPPIIERDYGRKPYLSKSYPEMMKRVPLRATFDQALQKKSQFEKPYLPDEEYPEMQHWAPRFPPIDWGEFGPYPIPGALPPYSPFGTPEGYNTDVDYNWLCSLTCDGDIGRCNGGCADAIGSCYAGLVTIGSFGTWRVTGAPVKKIITGRRNPRYQASYEYWGLDSIEIYPDWDKIAVDKTSLWGYYQWKHATFEITYTDSDGHVCKDEVTVACCTTCDCPTVPAFAYVSGNPTTIVRETNVNIVVDNGCADFTWAVTGTGFTFDKTTTKTGSNQLFADNTACGTGTITVTDNCGSEVTGTIRATTGSWGSYTEVDRVNMDDVCAGCEASLANIYWIDPVTKLECDTDSNQYKWKVKVYESLTPPAVCPDGQCPECDGYHGFCYAIVTDGICSYTVTAADWGSVYGIARLILYRSEWTC